MTKILAACDDNMAMEPSLLHLPIRWAIFGLALPILPLTRCPHLLSGQIKTPDHLQALVEALPSLSGLAWFEP